MSNLLTNLYKVYLHLHLGVGRKGAKPLASQDAVTTAGQLNISLYKTGFNPK